MDIFGWVIIAALVLFGGPLTLSIIALTRADSSRRMMLELQAAQGDATRQIGALRSELRALQESAPAVDGVEEEQPAPETATEEAPTPEAPPQYARPGSRAQQPPPDRSAPQQPAAPASTPIETPTVEKQSFEEILASRWLVWLGAVVIALGSVFLVRFAIEQSLLGPAMRDALTFLLGISLIGGGEWLRRKPLQLKIASIRPNYVPLALTASGLFAAFASIYAAHAFHGLVGPIPAFAGLAVVGFVAVGLSLLQGKFVALLGLLGAAVTPFLVAAADPSLWALFAYLIVIQAACLTLVYYKVWWSLGFGTLAIAVVWPLLILSRLSGLSDADTVPLGLYLLLSVGAFILLRFRSGSSEVPLRKLGFADLFSKRPSDALTWLAVVMIAAVVSLVVLAAEFSLPALLLLAALVALYLVVGRTMAVLEGVSVVAAVATVLLMVQWPLFHIAPTQDAYIYASYLLGGLFGLGGFVALWGAERPALRAGVSITVPLALLIVAYGAVADFNADIRWVALAVGLGAISLAAATRVVLYREAYGLNISLGFYAAGVVAFVSLAATMVLEQAWLTVALSVQLLALGWIYRHIPERSLEKVALIIASVVLIRLVVNPNILDYSVTGAWRFTWIIYGYGVPALTFFYAAKLFRDAKSALLVTLLQAGSLVFAVLFVTFHIRLFVAGSLDSLDYGLLEQSLHAITWLSIGTALAIRHRRKPHRVAFYGSRILLLVAAVQVVLFHVLISSPIQTQDFIGNVPVFNTLFLAYAVPAGFAFFLAGKFQHETPVWPALVSALLGFALVFVYLSLEVRHLYQGPVLSFQHLSDAEFYTYSLVWLVYALALLGLGITTKSTLPRYVSLAVLLITVLKAFIFDMADLSGLLRVSTFLILGLTLIWIGYLYQRFVFRVPTASPLENETTAESG
ncbi:MAG: DUF2339 domain-containing protein [Alphaproteobacteria bacterium]|nr:DUF2339 domain-containing protein [Alphaproteobacteria bacterium]